jgi:hypothetical protein
MIHPYLSMSSFFLNTWGLGPSHNWITNVVCSLCEEYLGVCFLILIDDFEILSDSPLSKRLTEKISNIQSKGDERPKLRKSISLDDLQERKVLLGISVDPLMKASRDLLLQRGVRNTWFQDPSGSQKGNSKAESKSSSSVKKMISAVEGTSPQVLPPLSSKHCKKSLSFLRSTRSVGCISVRQIILGNAKCMHGNSVFPVPAGCGFRD